MRRQINLTIYVLLFAMLSFGSLLAQTVMIELFDINGNYPSTNPNDTVNDLGIEFTTWIVGEEEDTQNEQMYINESRYYVEAEKYVIYFLLDNFDNVPSAGDILRFEIEQTTTGHIASAELTVPAIGDIILFGEDALQLQAPPKPPLPATNLFYSNDEDVIGINGATIMAEYPDGNNVYRANNWNNGNYWYATFSTVGYTNLEFNAQIRRQYDDDPFDPTYGPRIFTTQYSINDGPWVSVGNPEEHQGHPYWLLPNNENWVEMNFLLPTACNEKAEVRVRIAFDQMGWTSVTNNGWNELKDLKVTGVGKTFEGEIDAPVDPTNEYTGEVGGVEITFIPDGAETETTDIMLTISIDQSLEVIAQNFANPTALGRYFKFVISNTGVFGRGSVQLNFAKKPNQIFYRPGAGTWNQVPDGIIDWTNELKPIIQLATLVGTRNSEFEFAGDNGEEGQSLPVELSTFTVNVTAQRFVQLQWVSESETNMLGYNVYRAEANKLSDAIKISTNIIKAANTSVTTKYSFDDMEVELGKTYYYWLQNVDLDLTNSFHGPVAITLDAGDEDGGDIPPVELVTELRQNYPNPFNPDTNIEYSLSESVDNVELKIYNILGQYVRTLESGQRDKGHHRSHWDGTDGNGRAVTSGIYFYRLTAGEYVQINKMVLIK